MHMPDDIRCLSIRQPWAWLICAGHKPVENRTWTTKYRGPVLIHAALAPYHRETHTMMTSFVMHAQLYQQALDYGGIVGVATLVDVVKEHHSQFFTGPYGWVLEDARPLPLVPCKGRLGLWRPDAELLAQVREADSASPADLGTPDGSEQVQSDG